MGSNPFRVLETLLGSYNLLYDKKYKHVWGLSEHLKKVVKVLTRLLHHSKNDINGNEVTAALRTCFPLIIKPVVAYITLSKTSGRLKPSESGSRAFSMILHNLISSGMLDIPQSVECVVLSSEMTKFNPESKMMWLETMRLIDDLLEIYKRRSLQRKLAKTDLVDFGTTSEFVRKENIGYVCSTYIPLACCLTEEGQQDARHEPKMKVLEFLLVACRHRTEDIRAVARRLLFRFAAGHGQLKGFKDTFKRLKELFTKDDANNNTASPSGETIAGDEQQQQQQGEEEQKKKQHGTVKQEISKGSRGGIEEEEGQTQSGTTGKDFDQCSMGGSLHKDGEAVGELVLVKKLKNVGGASLKSAEEDPDSITSKVDEKQKKKMSRGSSIKETMSQQTSQTGRERTHGAGTPNEPPRIVAELNKRILELNKNRYAEEYGGIFQTELKGKSSDGRSRVFSFDDDEDALFTYSDSLRSMTINTGTNETDRSSIGDYLSAGGGGSSRTPRSKKRSKGKKTTLLTALTPQTPLSPGSVSCSLVDGTASLSDAASLGPLSPYSKMVASYPTTFGAGGEEFIPEEPIKKKKKKNRTKPKKALILSATGTTGDLPSAINNIIPPRSVTVEYAPSMIQSGSFSEEEGTRDPRGSNTVTLEELREQLISEDGVYVDDLPLPVEMMGDVMMRLVCEVVNTPEVFGEREILNPFPSAEALVLILRHPHLMPPSSPIKGKFIRNLVALLLQSIGAGERLHPIVSQVMGTCKSALTIIYPSLTAFVLYMSQLINLVIVSLEEPGLSSILLPSTIHTTDIDNTNGKQLWIAGYLNTLKSVALLCDHPLVRIHCALAFRYILSRKSFVQASATICARAYHRSVMDIGSLKKKEVPYLRIFSIVAKMLKMQLVNGVDDEDSSSPPSRRNVQCQEDGLFHILPLGPSREDIASIGGYKAQLVTILVDTLFIVLQNSINITRRNNIVNRGILRSYVALSPIAVKTKNTIDIITALPQNQAVALAEIIGLAGTYAADVERKLLHNKRLSKNSLMDAVKQILGSDKLSTNDTLDRSRTFTQGLLVAGGKADYDITQQFLRKCHTSFKDAGNKNIYIDMTTSMLRFRTNNQTPSLPGLLREMHKGGGPAYRLRVLERRIDIETQEEVQHDANQLCVLHMAHLANCMCVSETYSPTVTPVVVGSLSTVPLCGLALIYVTCSKLLIELGREVKRVKCSQSSGTSTPTGGSRPGSSPMISRVIPHLSFYDGEKEELTDKLGVLYKTSDVSVGVIQSSILKELSGKHLLERFPSAVRFFIQYLHFFLTTPVHNHYEVLKAREPLYISQSPLFNKIVTPFLIMAEVIGEDDVGTIIDLLSAHKDRLSATDLKDITLFVNSIFGEGEGEEVQDLDKWRRLRFVIEP